MPGGLTLADQGRTESVIDPAMTQAAPSLSDQLRAQASSEQPIAFRQPPHNIDAEQALLGAILVNNEALDRVSGFLKPEHFYDPLHGQIFETIGQLIHLGKQATPITLRTFFENAEAIEPNLTVPQYLGRLAVNATTIINCADYGRTIYDLSVRRQLITVGEDVVNAAFDSPVDSSPEKQIQEAIGRVAAGRTTVAIAHRLSTLRNATRLVVLDGGKIVESGTHQELMDKRGIFYHLVQLQQEAAEIIQVKE